MLSIRNLGQDCPLGYRLLSVEQGSVPFLGECFAFCKSGAVTFGDGTSEIRNLVSARHDWWHLKDDLGCGYNLRFDSPGAIALTNSGRQTVEAAPFVTTQLRINTSLPVSLTAANAAPTAAGEVPPESAYPKCFFRTTPFVGIPGFWNGSGRKEATDQGFQGFYPLVNALAGPQYIVLTLAPPTSSSTLPPAASNCPRSPIYLVVEAVDWSSLVYKTSEPPYHGDPAVKMGDLSSFIKGPRDTLTFVVAVDADVLQINLWFPSDEISAGGTYPYWSASCEVFGLDVVKDLPVGGGLLSCPSGTTFGSLPGSAGWTKTSLLGLGDAGKNEPVSH